jgi:peroxiredoxin
MATGQPLSVGEPAPWFSVTNDGDPTATVAFDELAGRYIILFFLGSGTRPDAVEALTALENRDSLFKQGHTLLLSIGVNTSDFNRSRVRQCHAGHVFLLDPNGMIAKQYGLVDPATPDFPSSFHPVAFILSPSLQIVDIIPLAQPDAFVGRIVSTLSEVLAKPPAAQNAPVLVVPRVFDRDFCGRLIEFYDANGGREIGLIESEGKIIKQIDTSFRKRSDYYITDQGALQQARQLLERRLLPMVYRAFQFNTTRIERYLVGCYDSKTGGYFRPHRDNTAPVVAHRRFAVTINLNTDYQGGELRFPEFGNQSYSTAPGDAIVFSCSLLHEVTSVTAGRRYAFLSFFYDEQSQKLRDAHRTA